MARARFQVLVIPYRICNNQIQYGLFFRSDMHIWQFIAGGGEDDETPLVAAKREAYEEAGIPYDMPYYPLDTCCSISAECFREEDRKRWGENCFVVPEHTFGVNVQSEAFALSQEHTKYEWMDYASAEKLLRYDSNKVALGELNTRISKGLLGEAR